MSPQDSITRERSAIAARPIRDLRQSLDSEERDNPINFITVQAPTIANNAERQTCASKLWNDLIIVCQSIMVCLSVNIVSQSREE